MTLTSEKTFAARRAKFRELLDKLGLKTATERIDWLVKNLHCSRTTARIWHMRETGRPVPEAKLAIMETLISKQRKTKTIVDTRSQIR